MESKIGKSEVVLSNIIIREFTIDDYQFANALWQTAEGVCHCPKCTILNTKERIEKFLNRNPEFSFVAVDSGNGVVVGTALGGHDGRTGFIYRVAVADQFRKRGIGTELVNKVVASLKSEGLTCIKTFVLNDNPNANTFWEKNNFGASKTSITIEKKCGEKMS